MRGVVWQLTDAKDQRAVYTALEAHFEPMATPEWRKVETLADLTPAGDSATNPVLETAAGPQRARAISPRPEVDDLQDVRIINIAVFIQPRLGRG